MEYLVNAVNIERSVAASFGSYKTRAEAETQCRVLKYGPWKSIVVVEVPGAGQEHAIQPEASSLSSLSPAYSALPSY
jgi:hypothetical protein